MPKQLQSNFLQQLSLPAVKKNNVSFFSSASSIFS